ncbi:MAG: nitrogen fixation protein NifH [Eubacteriales bacterium]|nr:nitrogen fixation protein NifH [Eubacteriales bacterium]
MQSSDTLNWLLEPDDPSVRYFALTDLLGLGDSEPEIRQAKLAIMQHGMVPQILRKMGEPSYFETLNQFYTAKYKGLVWQLILLAELGAEADEQIKEQCEYILEHSQEPTDGGFAMNTAAKTGGGRISEVIPCLTGNLVWSLIRFGYWEDPRLQKAVNWLTKYSRLNDGVENDPQIQPYSRYETCWGKHTCHMGVVKTLKALGAIPESNRSRQVKDTIDQAAEFLLIHHIYKRSHDLARVSKPGWTKFGFPLMYQTDVLEILDILSSLNIADSRMDEALDLVCSKRDEHGRWIAENLYCGDKLLIPFGEKGAPSKWLTLRAMRVLKRCGR